jgi:hypothetical protein
MVQTIGISENINLKYLRDNFGLQRNNNVEFFGEWQNQLPQLNEQEKIFLERIIIRYFYQLDEVYL